jgi:peptidyl-prolyl cis-trans isomerase-like protein 2
MGGTEDDRTTWTGKRIRADGQVVEDERAKGVGRYLKGAVAAAAAARAGGEEEDAGGKVEEWEEQPVKKKAKTGGFGNFDSW